VCAPGWSVVYLGVLTLILAAVGFASTPDFQHPKYDTYRNLIFGSAVGYSAAPVAHWVRHCDWQCAHIVAPSYLGIMGLYFVGYMIYMVRFPERWFRGFDTLGASHQIWHALVWAAGALWLEGMLEYRRWRVTALEVG